MPRTPKHWRADRWTLYHYYEDDKYGYGYVQPAAGGGYLAVAPSHGLVELVKRVKDGKALVEAAVRGRRKRKT